jgi:23S rRNA pseudouridine1911/1915/1917 synthase
MDSTSPGAFVWPDHIPSDALATVLFVRKHLADQRLDRFIVCEIPRMSRSKATEIAKHFAFDEQGRPLSAAKIVRAGDKVVLFRLRWDEPEVNRDVPIVYEDEALVVANKPAGLPVHATARYHRNTLIAILSERFKGETLHLCHRLDKETSGVIVAARTAEDDVKVKTAFASREIEKCYLAIVHGVVADDVFVVDAPMCLGSHEVGVLMSIVPVAQGGQPSRTRFKVRQRFASYSLLECYPETGRQHQIRLHLAHIGHPIVGDKLYAHSPALFVAALEDELTDEMRAQLKLMRHALHAHNITFDHPRTGKPITLTAPLTEDLANFLRIECMQLDSASSPVE